MKHTSVAIHESEYPAPAAEGLKAALRAGRLPGKFLYQSPVLAQRWLDYHAAWSPSRTDAGLVALYREAFAAAAAGLEAPALHVVGLGAGGGHKDADLLGALGAAAGRGGLHYTPVDASATLVLEAAQHAGTRWPAVTRHPLVADLEAAPALEDWLAQVEGGRAARVLTCLGLLPNQDPLRLPAWLRSLLRPGDRLLCSANLSPGGLTRDAPAILAQYDNPPARRWYAGALAMLGIPPAGTHLNISARPLAALGDDIGGEEAWSVEVDATPRDAVAVEVHGERFEFGPQRPLCVFASHRFTLETAARLLGRGGLGVRRTWTYAAGEEAIFLCDAGEPPGAAARER